MAHSVRTDAQEILNGFSASIRKAISAKKNYYGSREGAIMVERFSEKTPLYAVFIRNGIVRTNLAQFELCQLPGCCGVAVSYHASTQADFRGLGLGAIMNAYRLSLAKEMGYGSIVCTTTMENKTQRKILADNGWEETFQFTNPKTKHRVLFFRKDL